MSYNPESGGNTQPSGGNETRNMGNSGGPEQPGGQPTMPSGGAPYTPPAGGYTPPPQQGGYAPPPQGGYAPPPQGGYVPPQGGYAPPPPQGGGYGYGYAPPPPPLPTEKFSLNINGILKTNYQGMFQKWINVITKPNVTTHEAEIPNATWSAVLFNVLSTTLVSFIFSLLAAVVYGGAARSQLASSFAQAQAQTNADLSGFYNFLNLFTGIGFVGAVLSLVFTPLWFFLGVWVQLIVAKMLGGTPGASNGGYLAHSYLASLSYAPTRIISSVLSIIPGVSIVGSLLGLYQIFLTGLSIQAAQRMPSGRAQLAVWLPVILSIVVGCLLFFICIFAFAGILANATR